MSARQSARVTVCPHWTGRQSSPSTRTSTGRTAALYTTAANGPADVCGDLELRARPVDLSWNFRLRSRIPAFANLIRRVREHFDAIIAAVQLALSNSRLEGINAKIRLIQRHGRGIATSTSSRR